MREAIRGCEGGRCAWADKSGGRVGGGGAPCGNEGMASKSDGIVPAGGGRGWARNTETVAAALAALLAAVVLVTVTLVAAPALVISAHAVAADCSTASGAAVAPVLVACSAADVFAACSAAAVAVSCSAAIVAAAWSAATMAGSRLAFLGLALPLMALARAWE
jgi:hypothetical protein